MSGDDGRMYSIESGDYSDVCPLCGIHRQNAGFIRESCGDGFGKPGCFVKLLTGKWPRRGDATAALHD